MNLYEYVEQSELEARLGFCEAFRAVHERRPHVILEELVVYIQIGNVWLLRCLYIVYNIRDTTPRHENTESGMLLELIDTLLRYFC